MEQPVHRFSDLFKQLGLASDSASIEQFIVAHRPLPASVALADAAWWTPSQAQFLREQLADDADWAEVVDSLAARLSD